MNSEKKKDFIKFFRFAITGGVNTLIDFIVYSMVLYIGTGIIIAQIAGYGCGTINSYLMNRSWTFQSKNKAYGKELFKFLVANGITLLLSLVLLSILSQVFPTELMFAGQDIAKYVIKIPIVAFTVVTNFVLSRLWVFQ